MQAPADVTDAVWAYNNPSFYREMEDPTGTDLDKQLVVGNSVQVKYGDTKALEIVKEFTGSIPPGVENDTFRMFLTEEIGTEKHKFSDRIYTLWEKQADGSWVELYPDQLKTTGADGTVILKAGQKAVFDGIPGGSEIVVTEEESPFWKVTDERTNSTTVYTITMKNEFRPVLYAMKDIEKLPDTDKAQNAIKNDTFKFQLKINDEPAAKVTYWYVSNIRTDGGIPTRVKDKEDGQTDENGYFTLKYGAEQ